MSLLHSDDFESGASLASQSIYAAINNCEVEADAGLGGAYCVRTSVSNGNFMVGQRAATGTTPLVSSGSLFRISACYDHSTTPWSTDDTYDGPFGLCIIAGRTPPNVAAYNTVFSLYHGGYDSTTGFLRLYDNSGLGSPQIGSDIFPITPGTAQEIAVEVQMSTITGGTDEGGGTVASDGYIKVYVGASLVIDHTGAEVGHYIDNQGPPTFWDSWANVSDPITYVQYGPQGRLKNICIRDDASDCGFPACGSESVEPIALSPVNGTVPTCCDPAHPAVGPDPIGAVPPWVASCDGGGVVDAVADLDDGEYWG